MRKMTLVGFIFGIIGIPSLLHAITAEEDFALRCAAPGVFKCIGFETAADFATSGTEAHIQFDGGLPIGTPLGPPACPACVPPVPSPPLYAGPAIPPMQRAVPDTTVKISGDQSLVFLIPPPNHSPANIAGSWALASTIPYNGFGFMLKEHMVLYIQFRARFSSEMIHNTWGASHAWKVFTMYLNGTPCNNDVSYVLHNWYNTNVMTGYTACGGKPVATNDGGPLGIWKPQPVGATYTLQQGPYETTCTYLKKDKPGLDGRCWVMRENEWETFYTRFEIGTWGLPDSQIETWAQREGETAWTKIMEAKQYVMLCRSPPCNVEPGKSQGYNNMSLTPYMTGLGAWEGLPNVTTKMWFDELILSTQPIALPGLASPPTPVQLTVQVLSLFDKEKLNRFAFWNKLQ